MAKTKYNINKALLTLAVDIESVQPDPHNARLHPAHNIKAIKTSLEAYGQRKPIVVNNGIIEAGNGMWEAAKELGWTKIAAISVEDDEAMAIGYALMDNQSGLTSEWDYPVLAEDFGKLQELEFDLDLTGIDNYERDFIMILQEAQPRELPEPEIRGPDTRANHFVLVYQDDADRDYWLGLLGIGSDSIQQGRVLLTVEAHKLLSAERKDGK